jgi:hypothetical protein
VTRAFAITIVVASMLGGCVSIGTASPSPSVLPVPSFGITTQAPSLGVTATPTAAPTATSAPTASPTIAPPTQAPTAIPTTGVTAPPTAGTTEAPTQQPEGSPGAIEDFGADTLLFADDFSDDTSGWGTGTNAGGEVAYVDGALQFDTAAQGAWMWSRRLNATAYNVIHAEAEFTPSAAGYQGLLCSRSDDELWGGVVNADGLVAFIKLGSDGATILTSGTLTGWEIAPTETTRIAIDCAGTATGSFRMQLSLPDIGLVSNYEGTEGPDLMDRVGIYGESSADPYSLRVDNLFAYGGEGNTSMSTAAQALLQHVPADWRDGCFETQPNPFETGAEAALSCSVATGRSEIADYIQFDTKDNMDAAYQTRVDAYAVEATASCQSGPNETSYTIGGSPAGRILCAPQAVGVRDDWTHDNLKILTTLTDFDGSYSDTYEDWLVAGPE